MDQRKLNHCCRLCNAELPKGIEKFVIECAPLSVNELPKTQDEKNSTSLVLVHCPFCGHFQLMNEPVKTWKMALTAASLSEEMRAFRKEQFSAWASFFDVKKDDVVYEIGAGSGGFVALLNELQFSGRGMEWDPELVSEGEAKGLCMVRHHLSDGPLSPIKAAICINFLEHVEKPLDFLRHLHQSLDHDGVVLLEVPNFEKDIRCNRSHDLVAEHLSYFTSNTLKSIVEMAGFEVFKMDSVWHGDDLAVWIKKKRTPLFLKDWKINDRIFNELSELLKKEKNVAFWGASHQALTLLAMLNDRPDLICIADGSPKKQGRFDPAWGFPICSPKDMLAKKPELIIVSAAGFSNEVIKMLNEQWHYEGRLLKIGHDELEWIRE